MSVMCLVIMCKQIALQYLTYLIKPFHKCMPIISLQCFHPVALGLDNKYIVCGAKQSVSYAVTFPNTITS